MLDAEREAAVQWLMDWYRAHPHVAPWMVVDAPALYDPVDEDYLPARRSVAAAGIPEALRARIEREGIGLSMIAKARLVERGEAGDGDRIRPLGWQS